ncbi:MAG: hypothetical protein IPL61_25990 [Myxococcales bacterium]|nr:hypothetical protein [Myxococcales bacterium]
MAKRTPRQELRANATRAPYRRAKASTAAPPVNLDLPMPAPPASPVASAPVVAPTSVARVTPVTPETPVAPPVAVAPTPLEPPMVVAPPPVAVLAHADQPDWVAVAQSALGFADAALTYLPTPDEIVHRAPSAPEPPPGRAPRGDARSMRSDSQFSLIYRSGSSVVTRRGKLGEHGVWSVVEYPGSAQAAHAYAVECSRLIEQGFHDVP